MNLTSYKGNNGQIARLVLDPSILVMLMGMPNCTDTNVCQGIVLWPNYVKQIIVLLFITMEYL